MTQALRFDEPSHTYWLGDRRLPSVSEVIAPVQNFDGIPPEVLKRKSEIGKAAHLACQFLDEGDEVDPDSLDPVVAPYVEGWRRFVAENNPSFSLIEEQLYDEQLGYAGTPDRFGTMAGNTWLIDVKTVVTISPATALQTVAYRKLVALKRGVREPLIRRGAVQLLPTGRYKFHEFKDPNDWAVFQSLLNIQHWKAQHGK